MPIMLWHHSAFPLDNYIGFNQSGTWSQLRKIMEVNPVLNCSKQNLELELKHYIYVDYIVSKMVDDAMDFTIFFNNENVTLHFSL